MHELALARGVLAAVLAHAEGRPVRRIDLTVGALRQVVPDSLAFNFGVIARGTPCQGALLEQHLEPARLRCSCGETWELRELSFRCPACGGSEASVIGGAELLVESIEVEEEGERCTARG